MSETPELFNAAWDSPQVRNPSQDILTCKYAQRHSLMPCPLGIQQSFHPRRASAHSGGLVLIMHISTLHHLGHAYDAPLTLILSKNEVHGAHNVQNVDQVILVVVCHKLLACSQVCGL